MIDYIGKARDVKERVTRIFSTQQSSNSVARKIAALIDETTPKEAADNPKKPIVDDKLEEIVPQIVFDFVLEVHPVRRDFMKAYAVSNEKPCLNIGLEH